jgi:protein gp37
MNRTKIEWTNDTWNPVTGCLGPGGTVEKPNRCPYCYAEKIATRFKPLLGAGDDCTQPGNGLHEVRYKRNQPSFRYGFEPTFHSYRLSEPSQAKKPRKIFVCSMADLFGDWVPREWIVHVIGQAYLNPQHTFQFLTKNPKRLREFNPWPPNAWVGATVTNQPDADERLPWLLQVDAPVLFVSHEPLVGEINVGPYIDPTGYCCGGEPEFCHCLDDWPRDMWGNLQTIDWAIIGAQTGHGAVKPKPEWTHTLIDQYRGAGVPIFLKDNLAPGMKNFPTWGRSWPAP